MQQPANPVPAINYDVVRKFLENPSVPANQIALLNELRNAIQLNMKGKSETKNKDGKLLRLTNKSRVENVLTFLESLLLGEDDNPHPALGDISPEKIIAARPYLYALQVSIAAVAGDMNGIPINPVLFIANSISTIPGGNVPPERGSKIPIIKPEVIDSLLRSVSYDIISDVKETRATIDPTQFNNLKYAVNVLIDKNPTIDKKTKKQLVALIDEIDQLRSEDPTLTNKCASALIAIEESMNDPNRSKELLLKDLSDIFTTFFNDFKNQQTLGSLYGKVTALCGEEPEKTVTCATLLIQSLRIITTPKLAKDKTFLENYNKTAHSTNNGLVLTAIKAIINAAYSKITNQSSFFKDRAVVEKSQKAMVEHFKAEASESTETTAPKL